MDTQLITAILGSVTTIISAIISAWVAIKVADKQLQAKNNIATQQKTSRSHWFWGSVGFIAGGALVGGIVLVILAKNTPDVMNIHVSPIPERPLLSSVTPTPMGMPHGESVMAPTATPIHATIEYPPIMSWVNDYAGVLSQQEQQELNGTLQRFEQHTTIQIFVGIMEKLPPEISLEDYALELFNNYWKPGQKEKNNGVLFLIFMQQFPL